MVHAWRQAEDIDIKTKRMRRVFSKRISPRCHRNQFLGQGGKNLDEGEADAVALNLESAANRFSRLHNVLVVGEGNALHIDGSFKGCD